MIPNAMPPFDFGLGETADALRDQIQRFASDEVAPIAAEIDKTDRFPRELWPRMGELGLHGITVEEEYGGSGLGYLEHCHRRRGDEPRARPRSGCATARTPTSASTRSAATATTSRSGASCPS